MSRHGPRSSAGDVAYYEEAPRNRWDRERFDLYKRDGGHRRGSGDREIDIRINERRVSPPSHHHHHAPSPHPPPPAPHHHHHSPAPPYHHPRPVVVEERERFIERDLYSPPRRREGVYWEEPTPSEVARTALAPYRAKEVVREYEAASPARPARPGLLRRQSSLDTFDRRPMRYEREEWRPPSYVPIPLPIRRYDDGWEQVRYREHERDLSPGWEEEYRDVRVRRRGRSHRSRHRSESVRSRSRSSSSSSSDDTKSVKSSKTSKSTKSTKSSKTVTPPLLGKKGKTRMPKRLVHKQVIADMGLPFEEEEHFIIVQRALEKEHIDEVIKKSEGFKETAKVTYKYEEVKEEIKEEVKEVKESEHVIVVPVPPPPPHHHHHHHDHHSHSHSRSRHTSPARTVKEEIIEERIIKTVEPPPSIGSLTLTERSERRSDRSIRDEIRALEAEREALRLERRADRRFIEADRLREGRHEYDHLVIEERRPVVEEVIRVEKDRKVRKGPDPKAVAFAMATLT